jgi:hypothetical protein
MSPACKEYADAMQCTRRFLTKSVSLGLGNAARCETVHTTCRASTFFRVPAAHAFLNGLVRGFWRMACRDAKSNEKLTKGKDVIISKAEQKNIASNVARMHPTSEFDNGFKNMLENVLTVSAHYQRSVTCSALNHAYLHKVVHEEKSAWTMTRQLLQSRKYGLHTPSLLCIIVLQTAGCREPCKNITSNMDRPTSMLRPSHSPCHCDIILSFSYQAKSGHVAQLQKLGLSSGSMSTPRPAPQTE